MSYWYNRAFGIKTSKWGFKSNDNYNTLAFTCIAFAQNIPNDEVPTKLSWPANFIIVKKNQTNKKQKQTQKNKKNEKKYHETIIL